MFEDLRTVLLKTLKYYRYFGMIATFKTKNHKP